MNVSANVLGIDSTFDQNTRQNSGQSTSLGVTSTGPQSEGFRFPAEWEAHQACWVAWPSHEELWKENLKEAQDQFVGLCRSIAFPGPLSSSRPKEKLLVLVPNLEREREAARSLRGLPVIFYTIPFGDIWLRDTAPLFLQGKGGRLASVSFRFNGWGGKYSLEHDNQVSGRVSKAAGFREFQSSLVFEGGSIDVDGAGTGLTTRQCVLNPNRNPRLSAEDIEQEVKRTLGLTSIIWLEDGLLNDHTDGHIDNIARFVAPNTVVCMRSKDPKDPNHKVLERIYQQLMETRDAQGKSLKVISIPSPGQIQDEDGKLIPASYLNFYISNHFVPVPVFGSPNDSEAVAAIAALFPDRKTLGLDSRAILTGGGSFHCITQQMPVGDFSLS